MSASLQEVRDQADALLALLGVRIKSGRLIIHIDEFRAQRLETSVVHRPVRGAVDVDNEAEGSAQ